MAPTNMLRSVVAVDATHAWAVGAEGYAPQQTQTSGVPVIQRWDGSSWSRDPMAGFEWRGGLHLVAAGSPTDVWAVGGATGPTVDNSVTRVLHNDGSGWREVPFPLGNSPTPLLITGLAAVDGHAWLVGNRRSEAIIQEWDGQSWRAHQPPAECTQGGTSFGGMPTFCTFTAVTAFAADDVWAAGNGAWPGFMGPLIFHWNGSVWRPIQVGMNEQQFAFTAIAGRSPTDLWAVGNLANSGVPLAVHGDGTSWKVVGGLPDGRITGVTQDATGRTWVVGNSQAPEATLSAYSAAGSWVGSAAPKPPGTVGITLNSITAVPGGSTAFAVGSADLPTDPRTVTAVIVEYPVTAPK